MGGVLKPFPCGTIAKLKQRTESQTCLHIYAVVYVTVMRLAHANVNLSTSTFIFTIMAEMILLRRHGKVG